MARLKAEQKSPKKSEQTARNTITAAQERILMSAWDLFHERGVEGTSVDDILLHSNTGKSQFYHYFGSKEGLVCTLLEQARQRIKKGCIEEAKPINNWSDLADWFNCYIERAQAFGYRRGCPLGRFAADLTGQDEHIRRAVLQVFEAKKHYVTEFFIKQKAQGNLVASANPESLADFCDAVIQGATTVAKLHRDETVMQRTFEHALAYLKTFQIDTTGN